MKTSLIIFDFDGTLADTTESILATYRMSIQALGADFPKQCAMPIHNRVAAERGIPPAVSRQFRFVA